MTNRSDEDQASLGLRFRRLLVRSASFAVVIQVCLVLYALAVGQGSLGRLFFAIGIAHGPQAPNGSVILIVLIVFALIVRICCSSLDAWPTETEVDSIFRRRNSSTMLVVMYLGYVLVRDLVEIKGDAPPLDALGFAALVLLFFAHEIVFGPVVFGSNANAVVAREAAKDEFYRAMRVKASKALYVVVMLAGSAAVLLLHFHLAQGPTILFAVLYAGIAASLLYYDYLIWRADRVR